MSDKTALYRKIALVMQDVTYLSKDDSVEFGKTKYKAISEEKVTSAVRESLVKHGLIILPIKQVHTRDGQLSVVDVEYKIIDVDTGDHEVIVSSGTGADTQDKGVGKAMTYAYKYLFLRTFAIPTGEDPDKVSSAELDDRQRKADEQDRQLYADVRNKYIAGTGSDDGFEAWYSDQRSKGRSNAQLNSLLAKQLVDKNKGGGTDA